MAGARVRLVDDVDVGAVVRGHAARVAELDPLCGAVAPPKAEAGDVLLAATVDRGSAVGLATSSQVAADSESGLWGALSTHSLRVWAAGEDAAAGVSDLLQRWEPVVAARAAPGDDEAVATVTVPSRDVAMVLPLARAGFAPTITVSVRRAGDAGEPVTQAAAGTTVRLAQDADLDALAELAAAVHDYDTNFGGVRPRRQAGDVIRRAMVEQLGAAPGWTWVAEADGEVAGFCQVQPPEQAGWIAGACAAEPVAYLGYALVRPGARARGVGGALVHTAHAATEAEGVAATLLHCSVANPLSMPFWARHGYRPLRTMWQRRPAVRA